MGESSLKWWSSIMNESSSEGISKAHIHASCHWEHMGKSSLNIAEESCSLLMTSEKKREQVLVYLIPIYGDPVFILKHSQEHHASSCISSNLLWELLKELSDAVAKHWTNKCASWHCEVHRDIFVLLVIFLLIIYCLLLFHVIDYFLNLSDLIGS